MCQGKRVSNSLLSLFFIMIIQDIYDVFKHYYGENQVDLQTRGSLYKIYIKWNKVTITNEQNDSVDIYDFYAKLLISETGKLCEVPYFLKQTYTHQQWQGNYIHSHITRLEKHNFTQWKSSCLGTGPIKRTICKLMAQDYIAEGNRERYSIQHMFLDMDNWMLFCYELDKYVSVESLLGGPYYRMSTIAPVSKVINLETPIMNMTPNYFLSYSVFKDFIKYLIENDVIKFAFKDGSYTIGNTLFECTLNMSNAYIDWLNSYKFPYTHDLNIVTKLLEEVYIVGNNMYDSLEECGCMDETNLNLNFTFKGEPQFLHIIKGNYTPIKYKVLQKACVNSILYILLRLINAKYGKQDNQEGLCF